MEYNPTDKIVQDLVVRIDPAISNMSTREKVKLIDSIGASNGTKGLMIDFNFSHTGRRINRRVYSKAGHMRVANELYRPYPKPLSINHDNSVTSIIGRIVAGSYVDMMSDAQAYFKKRRLSESGLAQMDQALQSLDFEKAADAFHRTKVLLNRDWKGIGRVTAKAKITDADAIIKFIDQRYLTLSAEQDTDAYVCSICMNDWKKAGQCEHTPGGVYDGKLAFMLCGNMSGEGSSVVMNPADEDSIVTGISLSDSNESDTDETSFYLMSKFLDNFVDESKIIIEEQHMNLFDKFLSAEEMTFDESYELYSEILGDSKMSKDDFKNLPESVLATVIPIVDEASAALVKAFLDSKEFTATDRTNSLFAKINVFLAEKEVVELTDEEKLTSLLNDETLISKEVVKEKILSLAKTFGILDSYVAKEVFDETVKSLEDSKTLNAESLRAKEQAKLLAIEYKNLVKDHISISNKFEKNQEKLSDLLDKLKPVMSVLSQEKEINIENIFNLLDSVDISSIESKLNDGITSNNISPIENPVGPSGSNSSEWDKKVSKRYKELLDSEGKTAANKYFAKNKIYCSKDFNPAISE